MTLNEAAAILYTDAVAGIDHYAAVLRDADWQIISNCQHKHRTREAAERCAWRLYSPKVKR